MLEISPPKSTNSLEPSSSRSSESLLSSVSSSTSLAPVEVEMDSVVLLLVQTMHYTKPFVVLSSLMSNCDKCITRINTLARWDALLERVPFHVGSHAYPFSHLIPGLLAATTKLGGSQSHSYIKYELVAVATSGSIERKLVVPVNILRSILRGPDRNSQRVFPPTEVTASAVLPNVMYPKSTFPIELRMDNVVNQKQDRRWRMRKLSWKLEEHTHVRAYACSIHEAKLKAVEDNQKKTQLYKSLKQGLPSTGGNDGPSRNTGLHHLTVQTLMYFGPPPATQTVTRAEQMVAAASTLSGPVNQDIVEEEEEALSNRPADEALHFEEDFGRSQDGLISRQVSSASSNTRPGVSSSAQSPRPRAVSSRTNSSGSQSASRTDSNSQDASPQLNSDGTPKSELFLDELRVVAHGDVKSGWKSDFTGKGRIELVADIVALDCTTGLRPHVASKSSNDTHHDDVPGMLNEATISCDIEDPELGVYVSHVLVVEVIVAEEVVQLPKGLRNDALTPVTSIGSNASATAIGVPTGSARVLRMQFKVNVTERSGLGIAWDDEVPPTYEDIRALSPPTYENLGTATPVSGPLNISSPSRPTPAILYGVGETPLVGNFANRNYQNIDSMTDLEDGIQEFQL